MPKSAVIPSTGQIVQVRNRRFVVTDVLPSELPSREIGGLPRAQHLVSVSSIEDDGLGDEMQVVWEIEPGTRVHEKLELPSPSAGFDDPRRLAAFLDAVRWGAASQAD